MREIKFRVWSKGHFEDEASFKYRGFTIEQFNELGAAQHYGGDGWGLGENYVIQQYTGLKDKNGFEIYEGDILKITIPEHTSADLYDYTTISEECYKVWVARDKWGTYYGKNSESSHYSLVEYPILEVIGNIYETPELLEK